MQTQSIPSWPIGPPSERDDRESTPEKNAGQTALENAGVLIVEDDFLISMQTETALTDEGIKVVGVAGTAEEAVLLAKQHRPVLAVMDIRLAGRRDGIEAAEELFRELGIRCIFATAHDDSRTRSRAAAFAPLGWLAKPYTMASLIALVRQAVAGDD